MTHFSPVRIMRGGVAPPPLLMPVKHRPASVIKMKSANIKTPAITKGIIIDPSALLVFIKHLKGGEVVEKHPAGCFRCDLAGAFEGFLSERLF